MKKALAIIIIIGGMGGTVFKDGIEGGLALILEVLGFILFYIPEYKSNQ